MVVDDGRFGPEAGAAFERVFFATDFFFLAAVFILPAVFAGRPFFLTAVLPAAARVVFATGRFFDLLFFFAMITCLLAFRRNQESSLEQGCCHL